MTYEFANQELSIEELDAVAAGSLWGWIKNEVHAGINFLEHNPTAQKVETWAAGKAFDALISLF